MECILLYTFSTGHRIHIYSSKIRTNKVVKSNASPLTKLIDNAILGASVKAAHVTLRLQSVQLQHCALASPVNNGKNILVKTAEILLKVFYAVCELVFFPLLILTKKQQVSRFFGKKLCPNRNYKLSDVKSF